MRAQKYQAALSAFEHARHLEPANVEFSLAAARAAKQAGELMKADAIWTDILTKHAVKSGWRLEYASVLILQERHDEARHQEELARAQRRREPR